MIKQTKKYILSAALLAVSVISVSAQGTINSPYSKYGIGNLQGTYLPQNTSMGNLAYGISTTGVYNNINIANPASYSQLRLTAFDIGFGANIENLKRDNLDQNSFNANLAHIAIAVPVSKKSALSFGLLPYSILGYSYRQEVKMDTLTADHVYKGEGGLSRAFIGYGFGIGKNFNFGFNASYLFGNLKETNAVEFHNRYVGFYNSKKDINNSIGGLVFDLGFQYVANIGEKSRLTVGYTTGLKSKLTNDYNTLTSEYVVTSSSDYRTDTVRYVEDNAHKANLPMNHNFGISFGKINKWLIGADFRMADWSGFSITHSPENLGKTTGFSFGGQIVPNINAVTNYFALIDYRLGVNYDKTYVKVNGTDIDKKSINFGLGFPLIASTNRSAFYKINFAAEIGNRGVLKPGLVKENFYNFSLGFTINDRWFQKYKYD
ncbi:hypothetical protein Pedsa_3216 [Pseudopedobacter saltans DSM 12145]|uniref:Outer membrane protein n=1 Tax=Pseudopedobacter saltans (strain ATCC 51119 / DSM 12145 / JCM 21818 / CCUG 39354 / LMG 10337 / NBRC 100064 / NCIMB 13643) TaxID=762903 RepID=F0SBC5_PSESL|nr:hypothetical protein [Pseudopedobacter saltans]ADY53752.1 hypothetical protein Pedsa_3216 [Pseudopedobacter saltans DSM 12145]